MFCLGVCDWVSSIDLMLPGPRGGGYRGERSRITMTGLMEGERDRGRKGGSVGEREGGERDREGVWSLSSGGEPGACHQHPKT